MKVFLTFGSAKPTKDDNEENIDSIATTTRMADE